MPNKAGIEANVPYDVLLLVSSTSRRECLPAGSIEHTVVNGLLTPAFLRRCLTALASPSSRVCHRSI